MTQKEYQKLLDAHDWYWQMSDSSVVADRGLNNETRLRNIAKQKPSLKEMFDKKFDSIFKQKKTKAK